MTIKLPPENIFDTILKALGKERKVIVQDGIDEIYKEKGPYVQIKTRREGFLKALFRKKSH